jgi:hypothetical protein
MTTTVTLANMPSVATDVAVCFLDQTKLVQRSIETDAKSGLIRVVYVYNDGDPTLETTVSLQTSVDSAGRVRSSILLKSWQTVVIDTADPVVEPIEVQLAWILPGPSLDSTQMLRMIGTAYALAFNGVTTKVPNTGIFSSINRKLLEQAY